MSTLLRTLRQTLTTTLAAAFWGVVAAACAAPLGAVAGLYYGIVHGYLHPDTEPLAATVLRLTLSTAAAGAILGFSLRVIGHEGTPATGITDAAGRRRGRPVELPAALAARRRVPAAAEPRPRQDLEMPARN